MRHMLAVGSLLCLAAATASASAQSDDRRATFELKPNPAFVNCLARHEGYPPEAQVRVVKGKLHDRLRIEVEGLKPGLQFDLFTVQRSSLNAQGSPVPGFTNFGLAWYQTDLEADGQGHAETTIATILVNQIFGFDPDASLPPTNTFHVGFWFNKPEDAEPCGFDVTRPTPFNGEHRAGPLAMISLPNATTGLGPLCLSPITDTNPATCNP